MRTILTLSILATIPSLTAQSLWTQLQPATSPTARTGSAAVFDPVTQKVLLFGGGSFLDDTWHWNGSNWTQLFPVTSPSRRANARMVYDPVQDRIILYGGRTASGDDAETWEWTGGNWQQLFPANNPGPRSEFALFFDPISSRVILYGGIPAPRTTTSDTWTWTGSDWQQLNPTNSPPERATIAVATEPGTGRTLLFGGAYYTTGWLARQDTWAWTGSDWQQLTPTTVPLPRWDQCMFHDLKSDRLFMFGGATSLSVGSPLGDMWEWNGQDWKPFVIQTPSARAPGAWAYDEQRSHLVMFGGWDQTVGVNNETWEWNSELLASYLPFGTGCPGSATGIPLLTHAALPVVGQAMRVNLTSAPPLAAGALFLSAASVSLPLAPIGAPGCVLYATPELIVGVATDPVGQLLAAPPIPIPNVPALISGTFANQIIVVDLPANPLGVIVSNGAVATVGY